MILLEAVQSFLTYCELEPALSPNTLTACAAIWSTSATSPRVSLRECGLRITRIQRCINCPEASGASSSTVASRHAGLLSKVCACRRMSIAAPFLGGDGDAHGCRGSISHDVAGDRDGPSEGVEQASIDLVHVLPGAELCDLRERVESRKGMGQLSYMKEMSMGTHQYELITVWWPALQMLNEHNSPWQICTNDGLQTTVT